MSFPEYRAQKIKSLDDIYAEDSSNGDNDDNDDNVDGGSEHCDSWF